LCPSPASGGGQGGGKPDQAFEHSFGSTIPLLFSTISYLPLLATAVYICIFTCQVPGTTSQPPPMPSASLAFSIAAATSSRLTLFAACTDVAHRFRPRHIPVAALPAVNGFLVAYSLLYSSWILLPNGSLIALK